MTEKMEISVAKMEVQVERLESDVSDMKGDLKAIRTAIDNAGGAWKMLIIVAGFAAAVGSAVTKVWSFMTAAKTPM